MVQRNDFCPNSPKSLAPIISLDYPLPPAKFRWGRTRTRSLIAHSNTSLLLIGIGVGENRIAQPWGGILGQPTMLLRWEARGCSYP